MHGLLARIFTRTGRAKPPGRRPVYIGRISPAHYERAARNPEVRALLAGVAKGREKRAG